MKIFHIFSAILSLLATPAIAQISQDAVVGSGGGAPGGSSGQIQYNNTGAFGGAEFWRNAAGVFWLANTATPTALCAYNTTDSNTSPLNYERGCFDWTTNSNVLTIGTVKGGTGINRDIDFSSGSGNYTFITSFGTISIGTGTLTTSSAVAVNQSSTQGTIVNFDKTLIGAGSVFAVAPGAPNANNPDTGLSRLAAGVWGMGAGTSGSTAGWYNYAGQSRVTSDVTFTSTTTLGTVTGLSVNVAAGRTYHFDAHLSFTDAAAGGVQAAIAGTATATNIIYDGWIVDSGSNGVKGNTEATSLASVVASATTTGTAGFVEISGTITVNAAGTLLVQAAQNTSNATATTIKRGSTFIVQDMP